jgi:hypothetical protein
VGPSRTKVKNGSQPFGENNSRSRGAAGPSCRKKVSKAASIVEKTPCGGAADPVVEKVSKAVSNVEKTP